MGFVKKIIAITGTRADYGVYCSVFKKLNKHFNFSIIVTGMHLSSDRGYTIKEIKKDKYRICGVVDINQKENTLSAMADSVGHAINGFTKIFKKENPDLLMVLGDRGEMLAGAISAIHLNIPVAHIHGGELSGSVDENLRHAMTKLSHVHFVSNIEHRKRVIQLGENSKYVFNVGAPSIGNIRNVKLLSKKNIFKKYGIERDKYFILLFHPTTTDTESPGKQINIILESLKGIELPIIAVKSNTDAGGDMINITLFEFMKKNKNFKLFPSIPYFDYLSLLKYSSLLIGNSSSGIIESPSFKIPVINVGNRQRGRMRPKNILDVGFNKQKIKNSLKIILTDKKFIDSIKKIKNPYGDGFASDKILDILKKLKSKKELINKTFFDINFK
ncbi:MAG: UDP-N-acetylglucosamine 2-epimerase [Ignavibacteriae bacterium]|nr:UDP-N-acetylglucosamine 2-epimerase [Ignavibacteriota bacterium]